MSFSFVGMNQVTIIEKYPFVQTIVFSPAVPLQCLNETNARAFADQKNQFYVKDLKKMRLFGLVRT